MVSISSMIRFVRFDKVYAAQYMHKTIISIVFIISFFNIALSHECFMLLALLFHVIFFYYRLLHIFKIYLFYGKSDKKAPIK